MSFFGIDNNDLENEKRKFLEGALDDGTDIPVYTWGTERYDGLGDVLQEGGDDLNDETFGEAGPVGRSHSSQPLGHFTHATTMQERTSISPSLHFSQTIRLKNHMWQSHDEIPSIGIHCWNHTFIQLVSVPPDTRW